MPSYRTVIELSVEFAGQTGKMRERGADGLLRSNISIAMVTLKLIAPCDITIGPAAAGTHALEHMLMRANATEIARDVGVRLDAAEAGSLAKIGGVPPSHSGADAPPVSEKAPN